MQINYNNKKFRPVSTTENSEISAEQIFHYFQEGNILNCSYSGKNIKKGQLLGIVDSQGVINMRYHQLTKDGILQSGKCISTPEKMKNGKIRLHEKWQWTSGDKTSGTSILEEV